MNARWRAVVGSERTSSFTGGHLHVVYWLEVDL